VSHIRKSKIENRKTARGGFTLIELLLVIGIILILIGILLPTVTQVRVAAQTANTRQMISRIESGIAAYYSDFQANPGPFSQAQLKPFLTAVPRLDQGNSASPALSFVTPSGTSTGAAVTSTENLLLGLIGGLNLNGTNFRYAETLVTDAKGPGSLNAVTPKRYQAYLNIEPSETTLISNCPLATVPGQWNASASGFAGDTPVPEFVDKYSRPSPVLYMRATKGATGFLGNENSTYEPGAQYDYEQLIQTYSNFINFIPSSGAPVVTYQRAWPTGGAETTAFQSDFPANTNPNFTAGFASYFGNRSTGGVVKKDEYILISAGPDGRFGTSDDITNFRGN
jgi:prepilin-type N-terminal cleavage/methylation domain-containing protein